MAQCREHVDLFLFFGVDCVVPRASSLVAEAFERFDALARVLCRQRCTSHITLPCRDVRRAHGPLMLEAKNPRLVPLPARGIDRPAHFTRAVLACSDDSCVGFGSYLFCGPQIEHRAREQSPRLVVLTLPKVDRRLCTKAKWLHVRVSPKKPQRR